MQLRNPCQNSLNLGSKKHIQDTTKQKHAIIGMLTYCSSDKTIVLLMKQIEVTIQEIQAATRPNVYRNRKKYTRKTKHRNKQVED